MLDFLHRIPIITLSLYTFLAFACWLGIMLILLIVYDFIRKIFRGFKN
jgi:hypothetical protein